MSLLDDARAAVRVTTEMTDGEIETWVQAAIADMRRCGVKEELLDEGSPEPQVKAAILSYVKANYGYDNSEAPRFMSTYTSILAGLLNSRRNEYLEG